MTRTCRALAALGLALQGGACASPLSDAEADFQRGRYDEAKQTLASIEAEAARYDAKRRAIYTLYRGMTLSALGDTLRAAVWLHEAQSIEALHPGSLSPEDARRLALALRAVDDS